jgi:hypothetical protein
MGIINFYIQHHMNLVLLPLHALPLMQPLNVAFFEPLKHACSLLISYLL